MCPWLIRSNSLPGAATSTSIPRLFFLICEFWLMPPITQLNEIFEFPEKFSRSSNICNASSRVGARINDLGDLGEEGGNFLLVIF